MKSTAEFTHCGAVDVKPTVGVSFITIDFSIVSVHDVAILVTINFTVLFPKIE